MIEESIRKQSTIAALSKASILHDPTLVEDLSELRSVPRIITDEGDESVSGSVVITKRIPPKDEINQNESYNNNNGNNDNNTKTDVEMADSKQSRITSMCSSNYSNDSIEMKINQDNKQEQKQQITSEKVDLSSENNIALFESKLNEDIASIKRRQENNTNQIGDITCNKEKYNKAQEKDDESNEARNDGEDDEYDLAMEYSDSDFEDNLEQRVMHLDTEGGATSLSTGVTTTTPLNSELTTPIHEYSNEEKNHGFNENNISQKIIKDPDIRYKKNRNGIGEEGEELRILTDNEEEEEEEDEDEGFEDMEDYQPLPPPQELDPDKLYALYAFNGPDPSHCQLEQDEPCILLNDEDAYWWLVKRCRDNNIGFAPAEILETFPERLARLNCWKNENMTSSTINSLQSLDIINQNEREQQEQLETKKNSNLKLPYKSNKNEKSVSFSNIINYANRYIEEASDNEEEGADNNINSNNNNNEIALKVKEDKKIRKYSHVDEFTNEIISYNKREDLDENNSDIVSDASFNTGFLQPLNIVKIRESKSIKNIHNEIVDEKPLRNEEEITKLPNIQGLGIKELDVDKKPRAIDSGLNSTTNNKEDNNNSNNNNNINKTDVENYEENTKSSNLSTNDLHKIFEAPILPFGGSNSNSMKNSTSDYSISTIGEFSPSSSEWTNDSPNIKNADNIDLNNNKTEEDAFANSLEVSHILSTKAIRDISQLVENSALPIENDGIKLNDTLQMHLDSNNTDGNEDDGAINNKIDINEEMQLSPNNLADNDSMLSTESDTTTSIDRELEIYIKDRELQMSTTSMPSNDSSHKNQKSSDMPNMEQISEIKPTVNYTTAQTSNKLPATFNHPLVQEMYTPILTKIDILMNQIDDIIRR